ncbi:MAG: proton-conducting transporter membrane subunit [Planctomycetaceae bacterium]
MNVLVFAALVLPAVCLTGLLCIPSSWANSRVGWLRSAVGLLSGVQALVAVSLTVAIVVGWLPASGVDPNGVLSGHAIGSMVSFDGVSSLMFALVAFVGWVISGYSLRYLDGEATQGRYYRWMGFTLGTVSLMVISGNLVMFLATWIMTSLGLHQLLLHYGHRPAARRAAWTKFTISRIGDAALIGAACIIYSELGTLDLSRLSILASSLTVVSPALQAAGFLLVAGAVTRSAQFPFHTWLPLTMETPTPVSAFMHAGIVNAGGYLIIRTSPLVSLVPWASLTLAVIGGLTACYAAVVMLTQTSVKKSLAYSTIAQMGFMLLQCGLGAYSAAMLHILAHSLYKAHAFLSSGSVLAQAAGQTGVPKLSSPVALWKVATIAAGVIVCLCGALLLFGMNPIRKPGGLLLGGVFCLALTQWIAAALRTGSGVLFRRTMATAGGLCLIYSFSYFAVDSVVAASLPNVVAPQLIWLVATVIGAGFVAVFVLQVMLVSERGKSILDRWYVHAHNGFYVEATVRRVFEPLAYS